MKKKLIKYGVFLLLLLVFCVAVNVEKSDDFVVRFLDMNDLKPVKEMEPFLTEDGIVINKQVSTGYRGKLNSGPYLALERGKYAFAIKYKTDNPGNYFVIGQPAGLNQDGSVGRVFVKQMLDVDENRARVEFTLPEDVNGLEITMYYEGGELEFFGADMHIMEGYKDPLLLSALLLITVGIVGFFLFFYRSGENWKNWGDEIFLLSLLVVVSMLPYLNDYMIYGHDLQFHLSRIEGTYRALRTGDFPVRINPIQASGYGYASPVLYPQLFLYIPAVLRLFGMSLLNSYKILLLLVNVLTAGIAYFSFYRLFRSRHGALIGAALYTLCLYRLTNLFVRGALGETLAMAALPLIIYGMYEIIWGEEKRWCWAVLGFTIVLQSHVLSTVLYGTTTFLFCLAYIRRFFKEKKRILSLMKAAGVTMLLNLWSLIPFLDYMRLPLQLGEADEFVISDRTAYFSQMFANSVEAVGNNRVRGSAVGEMPLTVGLLLVLGAILFLFLSRDKDSLKQNSSLHKLYRAGRVGLLTAGVAILMTSWLFPWELASKNIVFKFFINNIQYFWRLLSIASIALCFVSVSAACMLICLYPARARVISYAGVILAICFCSYLVDQTLGASSEGGIAEIANTATADYMYLFDKQHFKQLPVRGEAVTASAGTKAVYTDFHKLGTEVSFHVKLLTQGESAYLEVPLYGYPGYHAYWNDTELPVSVGDMGVVRIALPPEGEEADVNVRFEEPFYWKAGTLVSLITLAGGAGYTGVLLFRKRAKKNGETGKQRR